MKARNNRLAHARQARERREALARARNRQERCRLWLFFQSLALGPCIAMLLLLFCILLALWLDGLLTWSLWAVFAPVWLLIAAACAVLSIACVARCKVNAAETSVWRDQHNRQRGLVKFVLFHMLRDHPMAMAHGCCLGITLCVFPVLVCAQATGVNPLHTRVTCSAAARASPPRADARVQAPT